MLQYGESTNKYELLGVLPLILNGNRSEDTQGLTPKRCVRLHNSCSCQLQWKVLCNNSVCKLNSWFGAILSLRNKANRQNVESFFVLMNVNWDGPI